MVSELKRHHWRTLHCCTLADRANASDALLVGASAFSNVVSMIVYKSRVSPLSAPPFFLFTSPGN